jgi:hypothetical protein
VFVAQSGLSRGASSAEQFYVSVGRGEKALRLYTDDKEALRLAVARSEQARSAAELWQASRRQRQSEQRARRKAWWQRQWKKWTANLREQAARQWRQMTETIHRHSKSRGGRGYAES